MCVEMEDRVKKYLALCKEEIYRLLINRKIYICLLLYVLLAHSAARMVGSMFGIEKAYEAIGTIASINNFNKLLVLVAAVPFALSYYEDIQYGYIHYIVNRSGSTAYVVAKITICTLTSFVISFVGLAIYCTFCMIVKGSGVSVYTIIPNGLFYDIASGSMPYMAVYYRCLLFAMASSCYAVMGMTLLSVMPNRFVAVTGTLFMNTLVEIVNGYMPDIFNIFRIQIGNLEYGINSLTVFLCSFAVLTGYIILSGLVFSRCVNRRISYESF